MFIFSDHCFLLSRILPLASLIALIIFDGFYMSFPFPSFAKWDDTERISFVCFTNTQALFSRARRFQVRKVISFMQRSFLKSSSLGSYPFIACNILLDETILMKLATGRARSYCNFREAWTCLLSTLRLVMIWYVREDIIFEWLSTGVLVGYWIYWPL
jgi:hypothetical protein